MAYSGQQLFSIFRSAMGKAGEASSVQCLSEKQNIKTMASGVTILLLAVFLSAGATSCSDPDTAALKAVADSLQGTWIHRDDTNWRLRFENDTVIDLYNDEILSMYPFQLSERSCDSSYADDEVTGVFVKYLDEDPVCVEITSDVDSVLVYRETSSGRVHVFLRSVRQ